MSFLRRIPLFVLAILLMAGFMFSQTQITSGTIQGTVLDPSGAVIPGTSVETHNLDTQVKQTVLSDESGRFTFLALAPGRYELTVVGAGNCAVTASLTLSWSWLCACCPRSRMRRWPRT